MTAASRLPRPGAQSADQTGKTLQDLRAVVRALEGRAPTMLAEDGGAYKPLNRAEQHDEPTLKVQSAHLARLSFDVPALDDCLGGGLVSDALHEVFPKKAEWDDGLTSAFALSVLSRLQASDLGHAVAPSTGHKSPRPIVWITQKDTAGAMLSPQGLMALGFDPDSLFQIETRSDADSLWAFEEVLNHPELGACVVEVCNIDLAQSHRIQLRAQETAKRGRFRLLMMLRRNKGARQPQVQPTSAATRWRVGPVPPHKVRANGSSSNSINASAVPEPIMMARSNELTPSARLQARDHSTNNVSKERGQVTSLMPRMAASSAARVRWSAELFRQRGGAPGDWFLEWSYEQQRFRQLAKLSGA